MGTKGSCKAESCEKDVVGKGYCQRHFNLWRQGEMPKARYKTCRTAGCRKRQTKFAHCDEHQKIKAKTAAATPSAPPPAEVAAAEA